ncbi:MAG: AAA family ATPase [Ktedonobacteraceae bacterium]
MRFAKLHLENWRNFTQIDVTLQQRMFLIGANATGKSNLLDAFRFLRDIVRVGGGFEKAVADRNGITHLRNITTSSHSDVVIDVQLGDDEKALWRYRLTIGQDNQGYAILKEEKVWKSGTSLLARPDAQDATDVDLLRQTHLEQISSNGKFRDIANFFNSVRYYHIVPQLVREPERSIGRQSDPYGGDFLEQMINLPEEIRDYRLQRIQNVLHVTVPQLEDLQLHIGTDSRGFPHLLGMIDGRLSKLPWLTEAEFSDGTLRLIGLLWALLDEGGPLLLEEPELSLHQGIVQRIPGMMAAIQNEHPRQILVSTHSDDLLRDEGIAPDEVLILRPAPGGTKVESGLEIEVVKQLLDAGLTMAEAALPMTQPSDVGKLSLFGEVRE